MMVMVVVLESIGSDGDGSGGACGGDNFGGDDGSRGGDGAVLKIDTMVGGGR